MKRISLHSLRNLKGCRLFLAGVLLGTVFWIAYHRDQIGAQTAGPSRTSDLASPQLSYITRVPPSQWELEGAVAASDFQRLLLRFSNHNITQAESVARGAREYESGDFERLSSPQMIKLEIKKGGLETVQAPQQLVMMSLYRYLLPLLVKNSRPRAELLKLQTPQKDYEFTIPPQSVRGFSLNLRKDQIGQSTEKFRFQVESITADIPVAVDVRATGLLKVRLNDSSGRPAARVCLTGSDGLAHMPLGSLQRIAWTSGEYFFYAEDSFEVVLPEGKTVVEAVRGIEYAPVRKEVTVLANQTQTVDLQLDHRHPLYKDSWYSGDAHIHANYVNNEVIDLEDIRLQISGEGLNNANLMVANSRDAVIHDVRFFEGKPNRASQGRNVLYWNEEMRNREMYGHMCLFNLKELVHPLFTGFPGTQYFEDYPPNYEQASKARAQGGAVTYAHPTRRADFTGSSCKEFPVDLALGQIDALDVLSNADEAASMELWYRALNCGFRCAISAGSDSFTNLMMHWVPGGQRVYVNVPGDFSYQGWIENYKKGKSFATNGPIINFSVQGRGPGEDLRLPLGTGPISVKVKAEARSIVPMDRLEVVVNGSSVLSQSSTDDRKHIRIEREIELERSSWMAARVFGPSDRLVLNDPNVFAHTSPVYCYLGNQPISSAADARFWVDWIEQLMAKVRERGVFATAEKRESVIGLFQKAHDIYQKLAQETP